MNYNFFKITPEDFEQAQLAGDMKFCRRCGIVDNLAVAMDYDDLLDLGDVIGGHFHMYGTTAYESLPGSTARDG